MRCGIRPQHLRYCSMNSDMLRFRTHLLRLNAVELEAHINLMPCVIVAVDEPVTVATATTNVTARAICIRPGVMHRVSIGGAGADVVYFDGLPMNTSHPDVFALSEAERDLPEAILRKDHQALRDFRSQLAITAVYPDPEIINIVDEMYSSFSRMSQTELASRVGLERTRALRHFKANAAQTFRRFKIWSAMINAVHELLEGKTITNAGINNGFADAAHTAKTARAVFGITPTVGLQCLKSIHTVCLTSQCSRP